MAQLVFRTDALNTGPITMARYRAICAAVLAALPAPGPCQACPPLTDEERAAVVEAARLEAGYLRSIHGEQAEKAVVLMSAAAKLGRAGSGATVVKAARRQGKPLIVPEDFDEPDPGLDAPCFYCEGSGSVRRVANESRVLCLACNDAFREAALPDPPPTTEDR